VPLALPVLLWIIDDIPHWQSQWHTKTWAAGRISTRCWPVRSAPLHTPYAKTINFGGRIVD
jgi:hypothetical protein